MHNYCSTLNKFGKLCKKRVYGMIDLDNLSFWNTLNKTHQGIATASTHANFPSILHQKKLLFFYFTHSFLQNTHISLSILHIYFIKYSFFLHYHLSHKPNTTHLATIINPPSLPASIINPLNHHHQATSLHHQPTQLPIQPSQCATKLTPPIQPYTQLWSMPDQPNTQR